MRLRSSFSPSGRIWRTGITVTRKHGFAFSGQDFNNILLPLDMMSLNLSRDVINVSCAALAWRHKSDKKPTKHILSL